MKNNVILFALFTINTNLLLAQDVPRSCENPISPFSEIMKGKIKAQVINAHTYFMTSTDTAAGQTYARRTANLNREVTKTFQAFMLVRRNEYRKTICNYYKEDWNKAGNNSRARLTCQNGFRFDTLSLKRTTNGDWKGGPYWVPNKIEATAIVWKTGGHKKNKTFVNVNARYFEEYIEKAIIEELNIARKELNDGGIVTELPPFID